MNAVWIRYCLFIIFAMPIVSFSQDKEHLISLEARNLPLKDVLNHLHKYKVNWSCRDSALRLSGLVSIRVKQAPLKQVLRKIFSQTNDSISYYLASPNAIRIQLANKYREPLVTVNVKNKPLFSTLFAIRSNRSIQWLARPEVEKLAKPVTLNVKNMPMRAALQRIFSQQSDLLTYKIDSPQRVVISTSEKYVERVDTTGRYYWDSIRVTGSFHNQRFTDVMYALTSTYRFGYFAGSHTLRYLRRVTINARNEPLRSVLNRLFQNQPARLVCYLVPRDRVAVVRLKTDPPLSEIVLSRKFPSTLTQLNIP